MGNCCSSDHDFESVENVKTVEDFNRIYTVGSIIGTGEFSEVKMAESIQGKLAVKCIQLSKIRNELHLLDREIKIMKKIRHPNIIRIHDIYKNEDFYYITMELCSHRTLKSKIKKNGKLATEEVKFFTRKMLSAIDYLHTLRICHRDIKPENILFKNEEPKLADFGLARMMQGTKKYSVVGTPYYLAPEIMSGDYNMKCDIWSLGVVVYYALSGRRPFTAENFEDLFDKTIMCGHDVVAKRLRASQACN